MNTFVVALVACFAVAAAFPDNQNKKPAEVKQQAEKPQQGDKFTTKYDNVDLDQILKSDRLLQNYVNCALDKGPCSPDGAELKKAIPEALKNDCVRCSPKQKDGSKKVINHLIKNKPDMWKALEAKYDPKGEFAKKYAAELKKM